MKPQKVFCIGGNKTGTTSMAKLLALLNFTVAPQRPFELLIHDWEKGDFTNLIRYVKNRGNAFQDIPFSLPGTFKVLDEHFPNSKFILTVRSSAEEWYNSLTNFHAKLFGNGEVPTLKILENVPYVYPGWIAEVVKMMYKTPNDDIYNKEILIQKYLDHIESVTEYFKDRPEKLLVVNLAETNALSAICDFLGVKERLETIPWENKT